MRSFSLRIVVGTVLAGIGGGLFALPALLAQNHLQQPLASEAGLGMLAAQAVSLDPATQKHAVELLRAAGPAGLQALLAANADAIARHQQAVGWNKQPPDGQWPRISSAVDAVAAQKDACASGLYWYTDLDAAKAAARATGKPILSLRLLGTLDTEYSCANSRFFRTVLYANHEVSAALSHDFILHWKSVRPVPKITIDFGDGRVIERTITGNSIHYVLDADGNVIDALPGLYGPKAFLRHLQEAESLVVRLVGASSSMRIDIVRGWHREKAAADLEEWRSEAGRVGSSGVISLRSLSVHSAPLSIAVDASIMSPNSLSMHAVTMPLPPARAAALRAVSKSGVESPLVAAVTPGVVLLSSWTDAAPGSSPESLSTYAAPSPMPETADDATWTAIAGLHAADGQLDAGSLALMAAKDPDATQAARVAISKTFVETPMVRMVRNFQRSIAEDTVRDEYNLHRQIHLWLAAGAAPGGKAVATLDALNEQVYAQLFLTPSSDPWLGLVPADTYTALPSGGLCEKK